MYKVVIKTTLKIYFNMRVSTKTHAVVDAIYSAAFIAAPFILNALDKNNGNGRRNGNGRNLEKTVLPAIGAGILAQGLMTDNELGVVKAMPMKTHLKTDLALSALIMASPWLFNFRKETRLPMVALGAASLGLALLTRREPPYEMDDMGEIEEEFVFIAEEIAL
jgi:hypothetical protein